MTTSVNCGYPLWVDGGTYDGIVARCQHIAASFFNGGGAEVMSGILPSGGQMNVTPGSGMSVNVATGYALCASSSGSTFGGYLFGLMSAATLTIATSDPTNPRVDMVCAYVNDVGTSSSAAFVEVLTGTPTAGATLSNLSGAPAAPANAIILAYVLVPASATSIVTADIAHWFAWTVAQGGILPIWAPSAIPAGYAGLYVHDQSTNRLCHDPSGALVQPILLPFAPQAARVTSAVTATTSAVTVASVTVNVDGNTDLEIMVKWPVVWASTPTPSSGNAATMGVEIDGTQVACINQLVLPKASTAGVEAGGGGFTHITTSGVDRPAAGSHTISLVLTPVDDGTPTNTLTMTGTATAPATLYVRAVPL